MANQQLIRGARQAANKFTDVGNVVGQAVMRGEQAILRRRAVENKRQELQAQAIAQLPMLDESQVPEQMREYAMTEAMNIRNEAIAAIQDKNISPVERQLAISKAMGKVNKIATQAGDFKQWITNLAEFEPDDLSKLNSPELMARVDDIYKGNYTVSDGQFIFADGEVKDFGSLVNTRPISRRSDSFLQQLQVVGKEYEKYGSLDEEDFKAKVKEEVSNIKYTDADLASILVDEMDGKLPEGLEQKIKDDFEDNGLIDDPEKIKDVEGDSFKEQLIKLVSDRYIEAARIGYDRGKKVYNKNIAIKESEKSRVTPYQFFQMQKYQQEQALKNNEYLQRTIPAIQKLSQVTEDNLTDSGTLQAITGLLPQSYTAKEAEKSGLPGEGVMLNEKYFISKDMDVNTVRNILANAMADSGFINTEEIPDILMSIKPDGQFVPDPQVGTLPQTILI